MHKFNQRLILLFIPSIFAFSCGDDDDDDNNNDDMNPANRPPGAFTASVVDITETSATVNWTEAMDPDGDVVTYTVDLGGSEVASEQSGTSFELTGLAAGTAYQGEIIADDGEGGTNSADFSFTTEEVQSDTMDDPMDDPMGTPSNSFVDPSLFTSTSFTVEATMVNCMLENGSSTQCYELTFIANPINDDGPFCPATVNNIGGLGIYDGTTNPGFQVMKRELFEAMEADGFDIIDGSGNIRTSDFSGMDNPSFDYCLEPAVDDNLVLKFTIPITPQNLSTPNTIETVELIGVSLDGVPMNGDPPSVTTGAMGNGNIPSLDPCGGHHDPSGYYHLHFVQQSVNEVLDAFGITEVSCTAVTQNASSLVGFAKDGYPIYSFSDDGTTVPSDLDQCNGHTGATAEFPDGAYHYHALRTEAPNMPPCLMGAAVNNPFQVN